MRVFYVAILATAALFATALARPGPVRKRHARRARSIYQSEYQSPQSSPDLDAIPTDWKYNQLDQGSVVPPYPEFPPVSNSDWDKFAGKFAQQDNDVVDQLDSDRQIPRNEDMKDIEEFMDAISHLNRDADEEKKDIQRFEDAIHRLEEDEDHLRHSDDARIPPIQRTHLPDLEQEKNEQSFGSSPGFTGQKTDGDLDEGDNTDVEPPVHKKFIPTLGQHNNDDEVDTNHVDQVFGGPGYPYDKHGQDQDQDQDEEYDYGSYSDWDDSEFDDDDSWDSDSFESDEDFQTENGGDGDQAGVGGPDKGFDGQGSIDRRLGNEMDNSWTKNDPPQTQRLERSGSPFDRQFLVEKCIPICEIMRHADTKPSVLNMLCDCANAPHMK